MPSFIKPKIPYLATNIAQEFSHIPQVIAIALAGSRTTGFASKASDFDFYIYIEEDISLQLRTTIAQKFAKQIEINNQFWEPGDEWIDTNSGLGVDIMYRKPKWIEEQLESLLVTHQASVSYSTCFWWNVLTSVSLFDRNNWFQKLQTKANQPYPKPLQQAIIAKNYPILRENISAYTQQITKAINRKDSLCIMHRVSALLASYFDIIFAINLVPHPGEKRLVELVKYLCSKIPNGFEEHIDYINNCSSSNNQNLLSYLNTLLDELDKLLISENLMPQI
jgi:predicted nucleotidyltransferase